MEFLGVGPLELFFILLIALIVLGPQDMIKTGKTIGSFLRRLVKSPTYQAVQQTSRDLRYLPNKLMREAGLEEDVDELKKISSEVNELSKVKSISEELKEDLKEATNEVNLGLSAWTTVPDTKPETILPSPPEPTLSSKNSQPGGATKDKAEVPTLEAEAAELEVEAHTLQTEAAEPESEARAPEMEAEEDKAEAPIPETEAADPEAEPAKTETTDEKS